MGSSGSWVSRLVLGVLFLLAIQEAHCEHEPTESECRPYIQKALKDHHVDTEEVSEELILADTSIDQEENPPTDDLGNSNEDSVDNQSQEEGLVDEDGSPETDEGRTQEESDGESAEDGEKKTDEQNETDEQSGDGQGEEDRDKEGVNDVTDDSGTAEGGDTQEEGDNNSRQESEDGDTAEEGEESQEGDTAEDTEAESGEDDTVEDGDDNTAEEREAASGEDDTAEVEGNDDTAEKSDDGETQESVEGDTKAEGEGSGDETEVEREDGSSTAGSGEDSATGEEQADEANTEETVEEVEQEGQDGEESIDGDTAEDTIEGDTAEDTTETTEDTVEGDTKEDTTDGDATEDTTDGDTTEETGEDGAGGEEAAQTETTDENATETDTAESDTDEASAGTDGDTVEDTEEGGTAEEAAEGDESGGTGEDSEDSEEDVPEEDLIKEREIPTNLRPRDHITQILKLDEDSVETETAVTKTIDSTLRTLKHLYDDAIKPLELLYKYRDLSNRHFGDPEIFSKPLVLFMGPWSGGKSSTINYLLNQEFSDMALRTGAEPSPAYFNILMYGEEPEILDGTQLAADWTFSGLQKFGQGLLDRLRGVRLPNRLLEKVNIVEIPGILEIRKQVQRLFPFNDACQWFIDRADIIFLVYDPAKLDVGPETEAILDQLKGREYQTRIILNKADQVKPEELMRVQGTLIWNISPLMSSQEPPVMYSTSLWSLPYESGAPTRLLLAQERAFLRDLREAIEKRVENKIASARRFAVRVRNHAKMVDCYLTTYYNHKTFFGNKRKISDDIIENPTKYHIYEGLSTLTNISRYDLPDPDMYKDFFRINPLYDFTKLSDTCTYFRGCPINKLDIAIAYDLPELVGKYKKAVEASKSNS